MCTNKPSISLVSHEITPMDLWESFVLKFQFFTLNSIVKSSKIFMKNNSSLSYFWQHFDGAYWCPREDILVFQETIVTTCSNQRYFETLQRHSQTWSKYFMEILLCPQRMVAELWLTDPLLEFTIGGILVFNVSRKESYIFESSHPIPIEGGAGLLPS